MPKKEDRSEYNLKLPKEVRHLISRKLKRLKQEQETKLMAMSVAAYSKMHKEMNKSFAIGRYGWALNAVPLSAYRELVSNTRAKTKEWPGLVWGKIQSTLEKLQEGQVDSKELNDIVDEYAWNTKQHPFTFRYIDSRRFLGSVVRIAMRAGVGSKVSSSFKQTLSSAEVTGQCGLITTARQERERISDAIDEYVIVQRKSTEVANSNDLTPSKIKRENRKLTTQEKYKSWNEEYRKLKKEKPTRTKVKCAELIAKMKIGSGYKATYIRRYMNKPENGS